MVIQVIKRAPIVMAFLPLLLVGIISLDIHVVVAAVLRFLPFFFLESECVLLPGFVIVFEVLLTHY